MQTPCSIDTFYTCIIEPTEPEPVVQLEFLTLRSIQLKLPWADCLGYSHYRVMEMVDEHLCPTFQVPNLLTEPKIRGPGSLRTGPTRTAALLDVVGKGGKQAGLGL